MAPKNMRRRVIFGCTVLVAVALVVNAAESSGQNTFHTGANLEVEKFHDSAADQGQDKQTQGNRLFEEAVQLLASSSVTVHQRVFVPQQSSFVRTLLSDELQKQKGILPTALRLVTQGFMSFFSSTPSSAPEKSSEGTREPTTANMTPKRHRDPMVAKAIEMLLRAGYDYGNDDALWTLANIHFHGQYKAKRDLYQAFDMYAALADRSGNATAQQMVGFMYSTGLGNVVERDEAKAVLYTTFAALGNSTAAELTMGYKHMLGIGTAKSCQHSVFYYKRAADKAYAMYMAGPPLGRTMPPTKARLTDTDGGTYGAGASGPGVPKSSMFTNIGDFMDYRRYKALHNDAEARLSQFELGVFFYTGAAGSTAIPRDFKEAGKYLRLYADSFFTEKNMDVKSIKEAMERDPDEAERVERAGVTAALLGKMYWRGEGYDVDEAQALYWFNKGVLVNNPVALNGLGTMYLNGAAGLKQDVTKATEYFKRAADLKYPDAQVNMGLLHANDVKTHATALNYFKLAAENGNFLAIYHLGEMYHYGHGVQAHCESAQMRFKHIAERGNWDDTLFLDAHEAYQAGDIEYAAISYLQAAERGIEVGQSNFAWILDRELPTSRYLATFTSPRTALSAMGESALVSLGSPSKLLEMALVYWTRSANQGDVDSRVKMGDYYFHGIGTEADFKKATACYQVAGNAEYSAMAMWNLGWMHENGVGVAKDFHLAKRWYDRSLSTNPGAVLPVTLSLAKLNARYIWSYMTGGETGESTGSFWSINGKTNPEPNARSDGANPPDSTAASGSDEAATDAGGDTTSTKNRNSWDIDAISKSGLEKWESQKQVGPGDDVEADQEDELYQKRHPHPQGEEEEPSLLEEDDLLEGLVIIGLCMVVGYLMYVRQFRFGPNAAGGNNNNNNNNNQPGPNNNNNNQGPAMEGLPGDPNAPGRFAYYAAGG